MRTLKTLCCMIALSALFAGHNALAGVGGFVDAQLSTGLMTLPAGNSPTFAINDGAFTFDDKIAGSSVFIGIPFQFTNGISTGGVGIGGSNALDLALLKGQAYVTH